MWAQQTYLSVQPEKINEMRKIFNELLVPTLKGHKGNVDLFLLEPRDKHDDFVTVTMWQNKSDAEDYERSGKYAEFSKKIKPVLAKPIVEKEYEVLKQFH
jgi:quinol monooxygenase YgiN